MLVTSPCYISKCFPKPPDPVCSTADVLVTFRSSSQCYPPMLSTFQRNPLLRRAKSCFVFCGGHVCWNLLEAECLDLLPVLPNLLEMKPFWHSGTWRAGQETMRPIGPRRPCSPPEDYKGFHQSSTPDVQRWQVASVMWIIGKSNLQVLLGKTNSQIICITFFFDFIICSYLIVSTYMTYEQEI